MKEKILKNGLIVRSGKLDRWAAAEFYNAAAAPILIVRSQTRVEKVTQTQSLEELRQPPTPCEDDQPNLGQNQ